MDKIYFIEENEKVSEALSFQQLILKKMTPDTLVCEKYGDWKKAKDIPELRNYLEWVPNPISMKSNLESSKLNNEYNIIIGFSLLLVVSFFLPWVKILISFTAKDIVFGDVSELVNHNSKFILTIFPIIGLVIGYKFLIKSLIDSQFTKILAIIPISVICYSYIFTIIILENAKVTESNSLFGFFDLGFWSALLSSIVIPIMIGKIFNIVKQYLLYLLFIVVTSYISIWLYVNQLPGILQFASSLIGLMIILLLIVTYLVTLLKILMSIIHSK